MNSSFHILVFSASLLWVVFAIVRQFLAFGCRFELVRSLSFLLNLSLGLFLLAEILFNSFIGLYLYVPFLASVAMGLYAASFLAFTYLGILDQPSQIRRKVLWRFPIVGALAGYGLRHYSEYFLLVCLLVSLILLIQDGRYRIQVQKLAQLIVLMVIGFWLMSLEYLNLFDLFIGLILSIHFKYVNDFMVKNLIREKLAV